MRPLCPCDPHQINYRVRLRVAGMLIELTGFCIAILTMVKIRAMSNRE